MGPKQENLFKLLGRFKPEQNQNWKTILTAIGEIDDDILKQIEFVRDNLLWTSAKGRYLDALASNHNIRRPKGMGMSDKKFRKYAPIMAYAPKQVRQTIEQLLELFYSAPLTSAFVESKIFDFCFLKENWTLNYLVDDKYEETILFTPEYFSNINEATPEEVAICINTKAQYSYADVFYNKITKQKSIRIFSKTSGSNSTIRINSGLAIHSFQFLGTTTTPPSNWNIVRNGVDLIFEPQNSSVNLLSIESGDIFLIYSPTVEIVGKVKEVFSTHFSASTNLELTNYSFSTSSQNSFLTFFSPSDTRLINFNRKAVIWEVEPGKTAIEFPATPPVYRGLKGSGHISGMVQKTISYINKELTIQDASLFPESGIIRLTPKISIKQIDNNGISYPSTYNINNIKYNGKSGNSLLNVEIPTSTIVSEPILSIKRENRIIQIKLANNPFNKGDQVVIYSSFNMNGSYLVEEVVGQYVYIKNGGVDLLGDGGFLIKEVSSIDLNGSLCYLTSATPGTGLLGPHVFDANVPFVITSKNYKIQEDISPGTYASSLKIDSQVSLSNVWVMLDFGKQNQEGPIKAFIIQGGIVQLDMSYMYHFSHSINSNITVVSMGSHIVAADGKDIGLYATDPSIARKEIQKAIKKITAAGITIDWLLLYRKLVYCNFEVDS